MAMIQSLIVYAHRTPIGKLSGLLATTPATELGATLVRHSLKTLKIDPELVDEIIMGQVLAAGVGQAPARQTAIRGLLPTSVCATTLNRVCGSGLKSVMFADQAIRAGDANVVFAGGQESMSLAPHLLPNSRSGYRFGSVELKDHMQYDGLWDPYEQVPMGNFGEQCAQKFGFSREDQDEFARESYTRARNAIEKGYFSRELVSVQVKNRKETVSVDQDEEPFSANLDKLADLRPAFIKTGSITAGNASSINDGAALTLLMSPDAVSQTGVKPIARVVCQASIAQDPAWFTTAPIACINSVLAKADLKVSDIDLFEINEAFSCVALAAIKELKLDPKKVNVHGGAVALGHPIGASGTRVLVTLIHALRSQNLKRGLATLCIGGGEASAIIVEVID